MDWTPKTLLGKMVKEGKITAMTHALESKMPMREPEIVDVLLPNLEDQVLDVKMVQRMTDSGRRVKFRITVVVGNSNGFIGLGQMKGTEVGPTIRKAIDNAKLNIIQVRRGCGSWECGCWQPHSVPFEVTGRSGSTVVTLKPAPRGVSLAAGETAKHILRLAGIKDVWVATKGQTRTTINFAKATFDALRKTAGTKIIKEQIEKLRIVSGSIEMPEEVKEGEKIEKEAEEEKVKESKETGKKEEGEKEEKEKPKETARERKVEDTKKMEEKKVKTELGEKTPLEKENVKKVKISDEKEGKK
ncbi:MAG: 30S ribosomal protein S5 [Thermoplasmatales archaeon]|nr:30S ribosomal protein S5 [Thermoplasmatales archaeon]